ncbi:helix-turn-helix transcriptional regulator [Roseibium sp.]|uniref:helix-turn-helix transcriptional regulator n=1 Tax=Roseibium sp. TaxID=1936156 RepID=UPI003BAFD155
MLSHDKVWAAIDALAAQNGLSPSGLARRAGLDPTAFNRSKRFAGDGRPRWPSTESLAKVLEATGEALDTFAARVGSSTLNTPERPFLVPLLSLSDLTGTQSFDAHGRPAGSGWTTFQVPAATSGAFALRVSDDRFLPHYRPGDTIMVSRETPMRLGDRLVVKPFQEPVQLCFLENETPASLNLVTIGDNSKSMQFQLSAIEWRARIIWASQ